jgi:hypothetical protein
MNKEVANKFRVILTTTIPIALDDCFEEKCVQQQQETVEPIIDFHKLAVRAWDYHVKTNAAGRNLLQIVKLNMTKEDIDFCYVATIQESTWLILVDVTYSAQSSRPRFNQGHTFSKDGLRQLHSDLLSYLSDGSNPRDEKIENFLSSCNGFNNCDGFLDRVILISAMLDETNRFTIYLFHWIQGRVDADYHIMSAILRDNDIEEEDMDCEENVQHIRIAVPVLHSHQFFFYCARAPKT